MSDCARILIVDDSRTFRAGLEAALGGEPGVAVAGSVFSGEKALEFIRATPPDVITLDVDMPGMDGLTLLAAIQQINRARPAGAEIGVIMVSAFTRRGAEITLRALQAGAFDFVTKPSGMSAEDSMLQLRREIVPRVRLFLDRRARVSGGAAPAMPALPREVLASPTPRSVKAVLIGCSTGGPKALATLLPSLAARVSMPIIIVQHMPAEFTRSLAESLTKQTGVAVQEAQDGVVFEHRKAYIAPGGKHLVVRRGAAGVLTAGTNEQPPESGCRPSASVLFRSGAAVLGNGVAAIVLTGMGNDGTSGLGALKRAGGYVVAQDEASSVVWGMPGSAVAAGFVDAVAPLTEIAAVIGRLSGP
jgi:two-component system, chemotaxis family, protein-glutamate methylesterase/glutaminase